MLCVPAGRGVSPLRPTSWGLHPLPSVLLSSGHGAGPAPEGRSVQEHVTSCAVSGTWSCSSGDDQGVWVAWRLPAQPQPQRASWVLMDLACAGCGLRPGTLSATTILQEVHEVVGVDVSPILLA